MFRASLGFGRNAAVFEMNGGTNRHSSPIHAAWLIFGIEKRLDCGLFDNVSFTVDQLRIGGYPFCTDGEQDVASTLSVDSKCLISISLIRKFGQGRRSNCLSERIYAIRIRLGGCDPWRSFECATNLCLSNFRVFKYSTI